MKMLPLTKWRPLKNQDICFFHKRLPTSFYEPCSQTRTRCSPGPEIPCKGIASKPILVLESDGFLQEASRSACRSGVPRAHSNCLVFQHIFVVFHRLPSYHHSRWSQKTMTGTLSEVDFGFCREFSLSNCIVVVEIRAPQTLHVPGTASAPTACDPRISLRSKQTLLKRPLMTPWYISSSLSVDELARLRAYYKTNRHETETDRLSTRRELRGNVRGLPRRVYLRHAPKNARR